MEKETLGGARRGGKSTLVRPVNSRFRLEVPGAVSGASRFFRLSTSERLFFLVCVLKERRRILLLLYCYYYYLKSPQFKKKKTHIEKSPELKKGCAGATVRIVVSAL